jgi:integrase
VGLFLSIQELLAIPGQAMKGSIRTQQKCPVCFGRFSLVPREGMICPAHKTRPTRFFISIYWKAKIRVFSDKMGRSIREYGDALTLLGKINEEIKGRYFDPSHYVKKDLEKFLIENLLGRFWSVKSREIAPGYQSNYQTYIHRAKEFFRGRDIREIRKLDLVDYRDHLGVTGKTLKNHLDHFRAFLRWVKNDLEMISNIAHFPEVDVSAPAFRWLSRDDQTKLFDLIPQEDKPIFAFMMLHGVRPGEARAIRIDDVDWPNRAVNISATFSGNERRPRRKGRGAKGIIIPLHPELFPFVESRLSEAISGAWLFPNPRTGESYSVQAVRKVWDKVRKRAGISRDLRLYDATRHSFASQLRQAGVPIEDLKDHLGHSSIKTTLRYAHGSLNRMRANLEKLSLNKVGALKGQEQKKHAAKA